MIGGEEPGTIPVVQEDPDPKPPRPAPLRRWAVTLWLPLITFGVLYLVFGEPDASGRGRDAVYFMLIFGASVLLAMPAAWGLFDHMQKNEELAKHRVPWNLSLLAGPIGMTVYAFRYGGKQSAEGGFETAETDVEPDRY
ncbi:hypothetical protein HJD18_13625 [Thermoleophilia bacterium SCSIO 60948]|nr:hypothetical protein HJD18_13625 [Thermoleophilia bacterium SCSIO 60948]